MDDFGDDLFDEFEKPSGSLTSVEPRQSDVDQQNNSEEQYVNFRIHFIDKPTVCI